MADSPRFDDDNAFVVCKFMNSSDSPFCASSDKKIGKHSDFYVRLKKVPIIVSKTILSSIEFVLFLWDGA
jgi:hypothetical protein